MPRFLARFVVVLTLFSASDARSDDAGVRRRQDAGARRATPRVVDAGVADAAATIPAVTDASTPDATHDAGVDGRTLPFTGRFTLEDAEATRAAARDTVRAAVRGLNPGIRETFGAELARLLTVYGVVALDTRRPDGSVALVLDTRAVSAPVGGAGRTVEGDTGRPVTLVLRFEGPVLVAEERTPSFTRRSAYALEGTDVLVVTTTFQTRLLPQRIELVARYRRASP